MKFFQFSLPAALLVAGLFATGTAANATVTAPAAGQQCSIGAGVSVTHEGLTASELKNPDSVPVSLTKPLLVTDVPYMSTAVLFRGDTIVKVDGKSVNGMTMSEVLALINNGSMGSKVTLTIRRDGGHIQRDVKLLRTSICK
jgi:S1-C subfamily serine protease